MSKTLAQRPQSLQTHDPKRVPVDIFNFQQQVFAKQKTLETNILALHSLITSNVSSEQKTPCTKSWSLPFSDVNALFFAAAPRKEIADFFVFVRRIADSSLY